MEAENRALYLGSVITMDPAQPFAEAVLAENGKILYVGTAAQARELAGDDAAVYDYSGNFIYPGFIDGHTHGPMAGQRLAFQIDVRDGSSLEEYAAIVRQYIEAHPGREIYRGAGYTLQAGEFPTAAMLDAITADIPIQLQSLEAHSFWLNSAALKRYGISSETAQQLGTDQIHVNPDGTPSGFVCDQGMALVLAGDRITKEEIKEGLLAWQDFAFSNGITATMEAALDIYQMDSVQAYLELAAEGRLKLRTRAVCVGSLNYYDLDTILQNAEMIRSFDSDAFKLIGTKVLLDGAIGSHSLWLAEEYADTPGYYGVKNLDDREYFIRYIAEANRRGLLVHVHAIGDGAVAFAAECMEAAEKETGIRDIRNAVAHTELMRPEDIRRYAECGIVAVVAPLWIPRVEPGRSREISCMGEERAWNLEPIGSLQRSGAVISFHTDYPVSPALDMPESIFEAVTRYASFAGPGSVRKPEEGITRMQALAAMTTGPAWQIREEDNLGSLTAGKAANMVIYDTDFLNADIQDVPKALLLTTVVDGVPVYQIN